MSSLWTRLKITLGSANADMHALAAMQPDDRSTISDDSKTIVMRPAKVEPAAGIIFYQGGRCDPLAYVPVLRPLAAAGTLVVIPRMPLRLAVMGASRADTIMAAYPAIQRWIIGGHSMGGAMAAAYAFKNPDRIQGLFFMASYPSGMHAMPDASIPVTMIYGTRDEVTRKSEFEASYERLPAHTDFVAIDGGDHYQFGSFGNVDVTATISRDDQQQQTIAALQRFVNTVTG